MEIILDLDDFSPVRHGFGYIKKLKEHYPDLKVTMFTPALDEAVLEKKIDQKRLDKWVELVKDCSWIEIAVHGFLHVKGEMDCSYKEAMNIISSCEKVLHKMGLPHKKIWKSPYWITSDDAYRALRDMGYVVAVDTNQDLPKIEGLKMYVYDKSTHEYLTDCKLDRVKYHGHIGGDFYNDISLTIDQLTSMPEDATFLTISEYIKKYGVITGKE